MKISANTSVLTESYTEFEAVKLFAKCGFDTLDLSMTDLWNENSPKLQANYKDYAKELKSIADSCGVTFNQAHAPYHSSYQDEDRTKKAYEIITRSMDFAALMGVKNIVIHPKQHLEYTENAEALKEMNLEFYNSLIPLCKEYNITVLTENMWHYRDGHIIHSVCAGPKEFQEYVDMLNSPYIKACLDIGHTFLAKEDIPNMIHTLGDRIYGLHVHDVAVDNDLHTLPYFAAIKNWDSIMKALAEVNYQGDLTFEIKPTKLMPQNITEDYLKLMHKIGEELKQSFLKYKEI